MSGTIDLLPLLGRGLYTLPDVARVLHEQPRTLRRWLLGYERNRGDAGIGSSPPVLVAPVADVDGEITISFEQFIELSLVQAFRKGRHPIPTWTIRTAAQYASKLFGTDYPFAFKELYTGYGSVIIAVADEFGRSGIAGESDLVDVGRMGQVVMQIARPFLDKVDYDGFDLAQRLWPLGRDASVVIDPNRSFGVPIEAACGVPTKTLFRMFRAERSVAATAEWFGVSRKSVEDAIAFESGLGYDGEPLLAA